MAILNNSNAISTTGGYDINNSVRLRSSATAYLSRTQTSGNRRLWTLSAWIKRGTLGVDQKLFGTGNFGGNLFGVAIGSGNLLEVFQVNTTTQFNWNSTQVLRDPSAWYHVVLVLDTAQATAANRLQVYLNGSLITANNGSYPSQNFDTWINFSGYEVNLGKAPDNNSFDGYLAETYLIDGQALTPSSFGETDTTTGVWKPKAYTGTYGTNGFYLKFSDIATTSGSNAGLGKDFSGNANYWTTNNISVTAGTTYDAMIDSPTLTSATVANYPTLNPLSNTSTLTEANLTATNILLAGTTMATPSTGKYYFEYTQTTSIPSGSLWVGVASNTNAIADNQLQGYAYASDGRKVAYNSYTSGYGATWTNGDVIGCALDLDNQTITFYKNNTSQGTAFTSITAQPYVFALSAGGAASTKGGSINCGQRPFAYTPPTGFVRLNTYNLPDSTIKKGNTVMDATTYTGDGATTKSITNAASFKPDLIWIKGRSNTGSHTLQDSNRGFGTATKLSTNSTNAENNSLADATDPIYGYVTAANSNGFTVNNGTVPTQTNQNGTTYVGWQWQAGQGTNTSNTSGSTTSTVSVNATAGFSIVKYTGTGSAATIGHGLGVAPKMIIVKGRNTAIEWLVYHASLGATQYITLNTTGAAASAASAWNNTAPTSSVFSVLSAGSTNFSGTNYVAYCWAEISGFSKFGSFTGNASADGPFVYLGFRPKFIILKNSSATADWYVYDSVRGTYNTLSPRLYPNLSASEDSTNTDILLLSNGFKLNTNGAGNNGSGNTIIYMAFAENPFKNALAR